MITDSLEEFQLFAELALALGGFTGVAAAFGGRDREFRRIEVARITGVFWFAGISLVDALLVISLAHAGFSASETYSVASFVAGLLVLVTASLQLPPVVRLYRASESTTSGGFIVLAICFMASLVVFNLWASLVSRESWPLVCGISSQLVWGLWMFARLLLRPN